MTWLEMFSPWEVPILKQSITFRPISFNSIHLTHVIFIWALFYGSPPGICSGVTCKVHSFLANQNGVIFPSAVLGRLYYAPQNGKPVHSFLGHFQFISVSYNNIIIIPLMLLGHEMIIKKVALPTHLVGLSKL